MAGPELQGISGECWSLLASILPSQGCHQGGQEVPVASLEQQTPWGCCKIRDSPQHWNKQGLFLFKLLWLGAIPSIVPAATHLGYPEPGVPSTRSKNFGHKYRKLWLHPCGTDTRPTSIMPTGNLPSGAMGRTIRSQTQQRPAGLDGNSTAESRSLDEGSSNP